MLYRDAFGFVVRDEDNFNVVCGEFIITIDNNDNVSITQSKPTSNVPQAYIVNSPQGFPRRAVEGSIVIIESVANYLVVFNNTINIPDAFKGQTLYNTNVLTMTYGQNYLSWYDSMSFNEDGLMIWFENDYSGTLYDEAYIEGEGWLDGNNMFYFEDLSGILLQFATENGVVTELYDPVIARTLFIREEGQWIYRGTIA